MQVHEGIQAITERAQTYASMPIVDGKANYPLNIYQAIIEKRLLAVFKDYLRPRANVK